MLLFLLAPAVAQDESPAVIPDTASVIVDGRVVFEVMGTSGYSASDRATDIADRLVQVASASDSLTIETEVVEHQFGHQIQIDGVPIVIVTQPDAVLAGFQDTEVIADIWAQFAKDAIRFYRVDRSSDARIRGLISGLIWTGVFILFTVALIWLNRRLKKRSENIIAGYLKQVEEATQEIVRTRALTEVASVAVQGVFVLLWFVALYYYVSVVLFSFAETRGVASLLLNYVTDPVIGALQSFVDFIPSLIVLLIIFFITRYLIRIARVAFENIEAGTVRVRGFQKHWVWPSFNLVRAFLIISALILAFPHIPGSDSAAFQGMSILLGVMVSIGSNSVVSNVLAGLFVIYRQSTSVGDLIEIGDHMGEVTAIKLTETHLKSSKNELISIPNAQLLNSEVKNYSQSIDGRGLLIHTPVGIGYDEPQQKIEALLIEAAKKTSGIKSTPSPFVLRKELGDFAVTYEINGYSKRGEQLPRILSELRSHILDVFHAAGVQIMSPHYEGDPETLKIPEVPTKGATADPVPAK
ncbi:mechanosensitive ion channel family protein [Pseudoruegeria sp. HB172150]|uniref:mechanosensitive ion channel family protein n=1 Tax=Pseudoruegeria sp. HB172150 TaxID=2721164 RepID=UPI0015527358|nr:mechanosensitive ion channel domain-containing protein [Pseudoruegeria sp. HB172150]